MKMRALGIWALIALCALMASAGEYSRHEDFAPVELGARARIAPKPFLFAEFLCKYGMYQNYLNRWIDRPLFCSRALRPARMAHETAASFAVHAKQLRACALDGFAVFANLKAGRSQVVSQVNDWLGRGGFDDLCVLPIISYGEAVNRHGPDFEAFKSAVAAAQKDKNYPRLNGKVLVHTYNYRLFSREEHRKIKARLAAALGNDDFILCGQLNGALQRKLERAYRATGSLKPGQMQALEAEVRGVLDASGGIHLNPLEQVRDAKGPYCSHYSTKFFDEVIAPVVTRILSERAYADKVLGFYVYQGYINTFSGHCHAEDGTSTLRRCLKSALKHNPDYLVFFEWNEVYENTMFQPTVLNGKALGRILRWYSRLTKGLAGDVYPGDDTAIANLTLSHRATVKVGEVLDFEILNIPDGVRSSRVRVQLKLINLQGEKVTEFPVETIDETRFGAISYRLSTADLRGGDVLRAVLSVDDCVYDNFHPIRISPTISWNYKTLRQSLRDGLVPVKASACVKRLGRERYAYSLEAQFPEKLSGMELIVNEAELAAAGEEKEYDRVSNEVFRLAFTAPPGKAVSGAEIKVALEGARNCRFHNVWLPNVDPGVIRANADNSGFSTRARIWSEALSFYVELPKALVATTVMTVKVAAANAGGGEMRFNLATVLNGGIASAVFNEDGARLEVTRQTQLADLPPNLNTNVCRWQGEAISDTRGAIFHFRAIGESGRIWRSCPIRTDEVEPMTVNFPAYDEFARREITASSPASLIPQIDYVFNPAFGASLPCTWQRDFAAQLGGGFSTGEAFSGTVQPPGARREPEWQIKDGGSALYFDGTNDYVALPKEALPQAAFTLTMQVRPLFAGVKQMVLFRHFDRVRGSISLFIRDGRLFATWGDKELTHEPKFATALEVNNDEWNEITVAYNFRELIFRVNGKEERFKNTLRAWSFKPSIFGGHDKSELSDSRSSPGYYRGWLRKLSITHNAL